MVRAIVKDPLFLALKSEEATPADGQAVQDLLDTLRAHRDCCVGLAANMIGVRKRILVFGEGMLSAPMINPVIRGRWEPYEAEEGCLSLAGTRRTKRYRRIEVEYLDASFARRRGVFEGFTAQIIQHEMDHFEGILI